LAIKNKKQQLTWNDLEQWSSNFFARGTLKSPKFFGGTPKYVKMVK
jgi:hypothetical protein